MPYMWMVFGCVRSYIHVHPYHIHTQQGRNAITRENKVIRLEGVGFKFQAMFLKDGEEETMKNASCFVILVIVNK